MDDESVEIELEILDESDEPVDVAEHFVVFIQPSMTGGTSMTPRMARHVAAKLIIAADMAETFQCEPLLCSVCSQKSDGTSDSGSQDSGTLN